MKNKELRELSKDELMARLKELKQELLHARIQHSSGQLENPARLRTARKEIARIETILSMRRLNLPVGKPATATDAAPAPKTAARKTATKKASAKKAAAQD